MLVGFRLQSRPSLKFSHRLTVRNRLRTVRWLLFGCVDPFVSVGIEPMYPFTLQSETHLVLFSSLPFPLPLQFFEEALVARVGVRM
jgi:hypothetical protein